MRLSLGNKLGNKLGNISMGRFVRRRGFSDLERAVEAERLRIRNIKTRGTYGLEYLNIVTPEFVSRFNQEALIRFSQKLSLDHSTEAKRARSVVEAEIRLLDGKSIWDGLRDNSVAIATVISLLVAVYALSL